MAFHRRTTRYPLAREKTPTANLYRERCASTELIEHVRAGTWNPDSIEADRDQRNAIAARGYWQAFQLVKQSIERVLTGRNRGAVADKDHSVLSRRVSV